MKLTEGLLGKLTAWHLLLIGSATLLVAWNAERMAFGLGLLAGGAGAALRPLSPLLPYALVGLGAYALATYVAKPCWYLLSFEREERLGWEVRRFRLKAGDRTFDAMVVSRVPIAFAAKLPPLDKLVCRTVVLTHGSFELFSFPGHRSMKLMGRRASDAYLTRLASEELSGPEVAKLSELVERQAVGGIEVVKPYPPREKMGEIMAGIKSIPDFYDECMQDVARAQRMGMMQAFQTMQSVRSHTLEVLEAAGEVCEELMRAFALPTEVVAKRVGIPIAKAGYLAATWDLEKASIEGIPERARKLAAAVEKLRKVAERFVAIGERRPAEAG